MESSFATLKGTAMTPKSVGEILDKSFTVLGRVLPHLAIIFVLFAALDAASTASEYGVVKLLGTLSNLLECVVMLSYWFLIGAEWQGRPLSLGQALKKTNVSFILRVLALSLWIGILTALYSILLIIPGIVYFLNRYLALVCICFEEVTLTEALERGKFLMSQERWYSLNGAKMRYASLILVQLVLAIVLTGVIVLLDRAVAAYVSGPARSFIHFVASFVIYLLYQIVYLYGSIAVVGFYFDLRARYEALDLIQASE